MFEELEIFLTLLNKINNNHENYEIFSAEIKHVHGINIFDSLIIQSVLREVEGQEIKLIAIKCIELKEEYRSKHVFRKTLDILESKNIPIFIDDILNNRLFKFLAERGYKNIKYSSNGGWKRSMYKLPESKKYDF